jgi:hypothetical protein
MSILIWCVLGVLALKVIWNFGVPYALMSKPIDLKTGKRGGVSLSLSRRNFFYSSLLWDCLGFQTVTL